MTDKTQVWSRTKQLINTDPQRRCYDGANFSEKTVYGKWSLFGEYPTEEYALNICRLFACARYQYQVRAPK